MAATNETTTYLQEKKLPPLLERAFDNQATTPEPELELVACGDLHGPLRLALGLAQGQIVFGRTYGVDILAVRVDTTVIHEGAAGTTGGTEAHFVDAAPFLVDQVADIENVQRDDTLVLG